WELSASPNNIESKEISSQPDYQSLADEQIGLKPDPILNIESSESESEQEAAHVLPETVDFKVPGNGYEKPANGSIQPTSKSTSQLVSFQDTSIDAWQSPVSEKMAESAPKKPR